MLGRCCNGDQPKYWFILAFAGACVLASAYGFMQGAWPFGIIEAHDPISTALSGSSSPRVARLVAPTRAAIDLSVRGTPEVIGRGGGPLRRDQNIDLPQLRNDLFRLISLPCHCSPPGCQRHTSSRTTSMGVDHPHGWSLKGGTHVFRFG
jgi:hypothetical protein